MEHICGFPKKFFTATGNELRCRFSRRQDQQNDFEHISHWRNRKEVKRRAKVAKRERFPKRAKSQKRQKRTEVTLRGKESSSYKAGKEKVGMTIFTVKWSESHSVMPDSLQPYGLYSPWNSAGQNTGVGSLSLLQGIFPTQGSNPGLLHCRQILLPAEPLSLKVNLKVEGEELTKQKWNVPIFSTKYEMDHLQILAVEGEAEGGGR